MPSSCDLATTAWRWLDERFAASAAARSAFAWVGLGLGLGLGLGIALGIGVGFIGSARSVFAFAMRSA